MNIKNRAIITAISTLGVIGIVGTTWATPDGSQRLRGLGDRVFLITAELTADRVGFGLPIGTTFPNCYIFAAEPDADGYNWFETAFPVKGTWAQDSNGAKTSYVVTGQTIEGFPQAQWGHVSPARGKGVLQLVADSFLFPGDPPGLEFFSAGEEIDATEIESKCPTSPIFTFPE